MILAPATGYPCYILIILEFNRLDRNFNKLCLMLLKSKHGKFFWYINYENKDPKKISGSMQGIFRISTFHSWYLKSLFSATYINPIGVYKPDMFY